MEQAEVRPILAMIAGYWPSPPLTAEEASAWTSELTGLLRITPEEARTVVIAEAETGREDRPTSGRVVPLVQALRRRRALEGTVSGITRDAPPERATRWIRALRRVAAGQPLEVAIALEGLTPSSLAA